MPKLRPITVEGEEFFFSLSFDIDDFIGDGIWWLQIYDSSRKLIYDKPIASSDSKIGNLEIKEIIKNKFLTYRGTLL